MRVHRHIDSYSLHFHLQPAPVIVPTMIVPFLSSMVTVSFESFIKNLSITVHHPIQNLTSFIPNYVRITQSIDLKPASKMPPISAIPKFHPTNTFILNTFNRSKSTFSLRFIPFSRSHSSSASALPALPVLPVLPAPSPPSPPSAPAIRPWACSPRSPARATAPAPAPLPQ